MYGESMEMTITPTPAAAGALSAKPLLPPDFLDYLCAERGINRDQALQVLGALVLARLPLRHRVISRESFQDDAVGPAIRP
jgi:hypothetical protein